MVKHLLRIAAVSISLFSPFTASSAGILSVEDSVAGLGTQAQVRDLPTGTYDLVVVPPVGREFVQSFAIPTDGSTSVSIGGSLTEHAGFYRASIRQEDHRIVDTKEFEILPDSVNIYGSDVTVNHNAIIADGRDEAEVTVTLRDQYGNPLTGRPVQLIGSTGREEIRASESQTNEWGEQHFTVTVRSPGVVTVRALDLLSGKILVAVGSIEAQDLYDVGGHTYQTSPYAGQVIPRARAQGTFDELDRFAVNFVETNRLGVGEYAKEVTITAVDRNGATVGDYVGTVRIYSPTDPDATLPGFENGYGETTFIPQERGFKRLPLVISFSTPGAHVLRVEDRTDPSNVLFGETEIIVGGGNGQSDISVTSHKDGDVIGSRVVNVKGTGSPLATVVVQIDGEDVAQSVSDADGNFAVRFDLDTSVAGTFVLRVQDASGRESSAPISLTLDTEDPTIQEVTVAPETVQEGGTLLIIVKSEPGLKDVLITVNEEDFPLSENAQEPGTYQLLLKAPAPASYQPTIVARDAAGNVVQAQSAFVVKAKGLPIVQNVQAEGRANAAELSWDAIAEMEGYRIYIGEKPGDFSFTLDTDRSTTSAKVAGLKPGTTYYFAVTALQGSAESLEKSAVVSALVLGTRLKVTPDAEAHLLE